MKICRLDIRNICATAKASYNFEGKDVLIVGPNGSGKSTIVSALSWLLTLSLPPSRNTMKRFRMDTAPDDEPTSARLTAESNGLKFELEAEYKVTGKAVKWTLTIDGEKPVTGANAVAEAMESKLGIDTKAVAKFGFIHQGEMQKIASTTKSDRDKIFNSIISLDHYEAVSLELQKLSHAVVDSSDVYTGREQEAVDRLMVMQTDLTSHEAELEKFKTSLLRYVEAGFVSSRSIDDRLAALAVRKNSLIAGLEAKARLEYLRKNKDEADKVVENVTRSIADASEVRRVKLAELQVKEQEAVKAASLVEAWNAYKRVKAYYDQVMASAVPTRPVFPSIIPEINNFDGVTEQNFNQYYASVSEQFGMASSAAANLAIEIQTLSSSQTSVGRCNVCGVVCQSCQPRDNTSLIAAYKQRRDEANAAAVRLKSHMDSIAASVSAYNRSVAAYESAIGTVNKMRQEAEAAMTATPKPTEQPDMTVQAAVSGLKTDVAMLDGNLQISMQTLASAEKAVADLTRAITDESAKVVASDSGEMGRLDDEIARLTNVAKDLRAVETVIQQESSTVTYISKQISDLNAGLEEIREKIAEGRKARQLIRLIEFVRETIHRDRLPAFIARAHKTRLVDVINDRLDELGTTMTTFIGDDDEFEVRKSDGAEVTLSGLSGGERCRWCFAYLFAIHQLYSNGFGLLILDEPTHDLDDVGISYLMQVLPMIRCVLNKANVQLQMITHVKAFSQVFEKVIDLEVTNE